MKIEKLPSGSYRIRKTYNKKTYTLVLDHKPTQKEALQLMSKELDKVISANKESSFASYAEKYIDMKRNVLSPRTIKEYNAMCSRLPEWFVKMDIFKIEQVDINRVVNELSCDKKPKTVSCLHGFITAVFAVFRPDMKIYTRLPQRIKNEPYIPSDDDVKKILAKVKDTPFEIPIILACYGLRRSEICALTVDDIKEDTVLINKALVQNENKEWIVKTTKTTLSTREIVIPMEIADKIREQGYVYNGFPGSISNHLSRIEKELGIPHFSVHKLRHYFASKLSAMNVPEADILKLGGWATDNVMKTVYRHSMIEREKQAQKEVSDKLSNVLFN